ncbi:MAG TPA: polyprenyl synthetase family protein [Micromonosporaceae bacterium]|nr:polyprenyl synthetase family protein [Micromonosporaceae bacterium]
MSVSAEIRGPFPFGAQDLEAGRLAGGVQHTLAHFRHWRDTNAGRVAEHVDRYTAHLAAVAAERRPPCVLGRWLRTGRRRRAERTALVREAVHFGVYNLAEVPPPATVEAIVDGARGRLPTLGDLVAGIDESRGAAGVVDSFEQRLPLLKGVPETRWLAERLDRLHRTLPEVVVRAGSMGKVVRTMAGVLVIGAYDTLDDDLAEARAHLGRILPAAYAYGAAYAIVDDTLHDLPGGYVPAADRERYHQMVVRGLATGEPVDLDEVPDHPLAEELHDLHVLLLESYPFRSYRHLYHAAESMYLAQHRDSGRTARAAAATTLTAMYPDIFIKASMSRVVANVLARRRLPDGFYARCVNTIFLSQLRDDLVDREEDGQGDRLTPFTYPPGRTDTNPLYDLFAYNAYVATEVFGGDGDATDALAYYGAKRLAIHLSTGRDRADGLLRDYPATGEVARFLRTAAGLPRRTARQLDAADQRLKKRVGQILSSRDQTKVDCRTFVSDRLRYLNEVTQRYHPQAGTGELGEIVAYAMGGAGKRLRPALSLMLAEGLGVDPASIEPVLAASELFHTASLVFDDLPAQDDATFRRGRPAAHLVFDEGSVQLAALSMVSVGFGLLGGLGGRYPPGKVTEVIAYVGTVLGPERLCRGQNLDLHLGRDGAAVTGEEILQMYDLKTSTAIEAALVPLMMVTDRPAGEIAALKRYAHHTGIVFQIRDDILDATSSTEVLGKDAGNDTGKVNLVRVYGLAEADRLMRAHLADAVRCCEQLPFDTDLLKCTVHHFASRRR